MGLEFSSYLWYSQTQTLENRVEKMCTFINSNFCNKKVAFLPFAGRKSHSNLLLIRLHISASGGQSTGDFLIKIFCMSVAAHANAQGAGSALGWMELQIF